MTTTAGQNKPKEATLTPKQLAFIAEWIVCRNATQAAKRANVPERTARRWVKDAKVQAEMRRQWGDVLGQLAARLAGLSDKAITVADKVLDDEDAPLGARLAVVRLALQSTPGWVETHDLAERITALEAALVQS